MEKPTDSWLANATSRELDLIGAVARAAVHLYTAQCDQSPSAFGMTRACERVLFDATRALQECLLNAENRRRIAEKTRTPGGR